MLSPIIPLHLAFVLSIPNSVEWVGQHPMLTFSPRSEVVADCSPALTRQAASSFLELLGFMIAVVRRAEPVQPAEEEKAAFARELATDYCKSTTAEGRAVIASAPALLQEVRTNWPQLSEPEQAEVRAMWHAALGPLLGNEPEPDGLAIEQYADSVQDEQRRWQFLSEMARLRHETQMTIIRNMGSGRYEYEDR